MSGGPSGADVVFDDRGLLTAVVQDADTREILVVAYMNRDALARTIAGPNVWFYSRSRRELWEKGATSGNYLHVVDLRLDCDGDAILVTARPHGPTCHTGEPSCFHRAVDPDYTSVDRIGPGILTQLAELVATRAAELPEGSYTTSLFREGTSRIAQKVIEEAGEFALAAATDNRDDVADELADLLYHALVLLRAVDVEGDAVWRALTDRRR